MEINKGTITANVECKKCKSIFTIGKGNVTFDKMYEDENGRSIFLTYFDCPDCQERHYVQVDNQQSREVKKKVQRMFAKFSVISKSENKQIPKQQQNKFNRLRKDLNDRRLELMKQYDDSIVTDTETGDKIKLNFTIV